MKHFAFDKTPHQIESIIQTAEKILSQRFSTDIQLHLAAFCSQGRCSIVVRCQVEPGFYDIPQTFIVKKALPRLDTDGPYDPESRDFHNTAQWLFNDWAAAQFLGKISNHPPLAPAFYGGDREAGLIVLEDLGESPNTADILQGNDPQFAKETLIEHVALLGQLHGKTIDRSEEYQRIRDALGPRPNPPALYREPWTGAFGRHIQASEIGEAIKIYRAGFEAIGIKPHAGVAQEIEYITQVVEGDPVPFLAYGKGDQGLGGDWIRCGSQMRLFDFGTGCFKHALIEGMPGRMTWGCMMHLPAHLLPRMEAAYQAEFAKGCPQAADDAVFHRAMVEAGARWNIFHAIERVPDALRRERQRGPTTLRQQVVAWIQAFADLPEEFNSMPALGKSARDMAVRLRKLWPAESTDLPCYPAFQQ
jgi:hypothetical protein